MTKTHSDILTCLHINLANAKTQAMREFVQQQITDFTASIAPKPKITPRPQPNWDRIIPNESPA